MEERGKGLIVRQLNELRRRGAAPASEARLASIFARNEAACREQEAQLAEDDPTQRTLAPPTA